MVGFTYRFRLILLLILGLIASNLYAQEPPKNYRLSRGPVTITALLPEDIKIQWGALLGTTTIAAWGTTERTDTTSLISVIRVQLLRDSVPFTMPSTITSSDARPSKFLRVAPALDRFLVFWNDNRPHAPGTYLRVIDTNGVLQSEEILVDTTRFMTQEIRVGRNGNGYTVLWRQQSDSNLHITRLDSAAMPIRTFIAPFAISRDSIFQYTFDRNGSLIIADIGKKFFIIDDQDRFQKIKFDFTSKIAGPYSLNIDGSVSVLVDKTLYVYTSIFDTYPSRTILPPIPSNVLSGTQVLFSDEQGRHHVLCVVSDEQSAILQYASVDVIKLLEDHQGIFRNMGSVGKVPAFDRGVDPRDNRYPETTIRPLNGSTRPLGYRTYLIQMRHNYQSRFTDHDGRPRESAGTITTYGSVSIDMIESLTYNSIALRPRYDPLYTPYMAPRIKRLQDIDSSVVQVTTGNLWTRLATAAATVDRPTAARFSLPGIGLHDHHIMVGWLASTDAVTAEIGVWNPASSPGFSELSSLKIPLTPIKTGRLFLQSNPTIITAGNRAALFVTSDWSNNDRRIDLYAPETSKPSVYSPITENWRLVHTAGFWPGTGYYFTPYTTYGCNPASGNMIIAQGAMHYSKNPPSLPRWRFWATQLREPAFLWSISLYNTSITVLQGIIPIRDRQFLLLHDDTLARYDGETLQSATPFPGDSGINMRTFGDKFLHVSWDRLCATLSLHDFSGNRLTSTTICLPRDTSLVGDNHIIGITAIQSPKTNGFALLATTRRTGLLLYTFDSELRPLTTSQQINDVHANIASPQGVFRNDTLFVVWTDHRFSDTNPDIYGTFMVPNTGTEQSTEVEFDSPIESRHDIIVAPNPAIDLMTVRVTSVPHTGATMVLTDLRGIEMQRWRMESGQTSSTVHVSDLPNGVYVLHMQGDRQTITTIVTIAR